MTADLLSDTSEFRSGEATSSSGTSGDSDVFIDDMDGEDFVETPQQSSANYSRVKMNVF